MASTTLPFRLIRPRRRSHWPNKIFVRKCIFTDCFFLVLKQEILQFFGYGPMDHEMNPSYFLLFLSNSKREKVVWWRHNSWSPFSSIFLLDFFSNSTRARINTNWTPQWFVQYVEMCIPTDLCLKYRKKKKNFIKTCFSSCGKLELIR